jgi:hypothetical protein
MGKTHNLQSRLQVFGKKKKQNAYFQVNGVIKCTYRLSIISKCIKLLM